MQELMCFKALHINTLSVLYSLRLKGGGYSPLAPLNLPLRNIYAFMEDCVVNDWHVLIEHHWVLDTVRNFAELIVNIAMMTLWVDGYS